jgi:hypothetical protein
MKAEGFYAQMAQAEGLEVLKVERKKSIHLHVRAPDGRKRMIAAPSVISGDRHGILNKRAEFRQFARGSRP